MLHFHLIPTQAANNMVMVVTCKFIGQVSAPASLCVARKTILREEFQCTIHGRLGEIGVILFCPPVDIARSEVPPRMTKGMQDRHPLRGYAIPAQA